jgi:NDP-sugar pyrophosphorylase family protein
MLNIVVPIAGRGSRFQSEGYSLPKPLIPVHERPMIELVVKNIRPKEAHRFIFLALAEHLKAHPMAAVLKSIAPDCVVVSVDSVTEGAACTVLLAKEHINNSDGLMIANSDQWVDCDIETYLRGMAGRDGLIMTMSANDPKWSYVRRDSAGRVTEVVEKKVISNEATVGIYNFRSGADFVRGAERMIAKQLRVNGEFYVAPVYNELIGDGMDIGIFNVGAEMDGMYGLGIPSDLKKFLSLPISRVAAGLVPAR